MYLYGNNAIDSLSLMRTIIMFGLTPKVSKERYLELKRAAQELSHKRHVQELTSWAQKYAISTITNDEKIKGIREKMIFMSNLLNPDDETFLDCVIERGKIGIPSDGVWAINKDLHSTYFGAVLKLMELNKYKEYLSPEIKEKIDLYNRDSKKNVRQKGCRKFS